MHGSLVIGLVLLASCGRFGFSVDQIGDAATDDASDIGPDTSVDSALLLWFPFDGTIGNRGSLQVEVSCDPTCPSTVAGKRIAAAGFDGATTAVRIADSPELHVTTGTIATWIRPTMLPPFGEVRSVAGAAYGTQSLNTWEVYFENMGTVELITGGDAVGGPQLRFAWNRDIATWIHVASAWDGTTHRLYLDGIEQASAPQFAIEYDNHDVMIGVDENQFGLTHHFAGDIDDLRFYNRALSADEIAQLVAL